MRKKVDWLLVLCVVGTVYFIGHVIALIWRSI